MLTYCFRILDFFGISAEECPDVRIINIESDMAKYKPTTTEITAENLKAFSTEYLEGNLQVCGRMIFCSMTLVKETPDG